MTTARTAQHVLESRNVFNWISGFKLLGMPEWSGQGIVDLNAVMPSSLINEDHYRNRPVMGKAKMRNFAGSLP